MGDMLTVPVRDLADWGVAAAEVHQEHILHDVYVRPIGEDRPGMVMVDGTEHIHWKEFELADVPTWESATPEQVSAACNAIRDNYDATFVFVGSADDDVWLEVTWSVYVPPGTALGEAIVQIVAMTPGPVAFHNNSNGAYGATGNVRREVAEAVRAVSDAVPVAG